MKKKKNIIIAVIAIVVIAVIAVTAVILTKKLDSEENFSGTVVNISDKRKLISNSVIQWDSNEKKHENPQINEEAKCSITLNNEIHNYADIQECWVDANTTYKNKGELEFTLYSDWVADENGIFGEDSASYINGEGGLLIKNWTSKLIINFNGYKIDRNTSGNSVKYGSVIKVDESKNVYFTNGCITGGANTDDGGGVLIYGTSRVHFENMTITKNISGYNGGGIYVGSHAYVYFDNVAIEGNYAENYGGGVYCDYKSSGSATEGNRIDEATNVVTIKNNKAKYYGYYNLTLDSELNSSAHLKNVSLTEGSAIYVSMDEENNEFRDVVESEDRSNDEYFYLDNSSSCKFKVDNSNRTDSKKILGMICSK